MPHNYKDWDVLFFKFSCIPVCQNVYISAEVHDKILVFSQKMRRQKLYKVCKSKFLLENKKIFQLLFLLLTIWGEVKLSRRFLIHSTIYRPQTLFMIFWSFGTSMYYQKPAEESLSQDEIMITVAWLTLTLKICVCRE
jgi:hypothetical protein